MVVRAEGSTLVLAGTRRSRSSLCKFINELLDDRCDITDQSDFGMDVIVYRFWFNFDSDEFNSFRPFRGGSIVQDPIQSRSEDENDVGTSESGGSGCGDTEWMIVGH